MVVVVDASAIVAATDRNDANHHTAANALRGTREPLVVPAPVTAEIDYMVGLRVGRAARLAFLRDVNRGRFVVACLDTAEYAAVLELENRYAALNPGLADLSIVVLAARFRTRRVLTFDERHFRAFEPLQGGRFTILPADADAEDAGT